MKLTLYMKSGNKIVQRGVKAYEVRFRGNEITQLMIKLRWLRIGPTLLVGSVALDQIEAVTCT